ncbi:PaaI family thioesterase [Sulfolobus sp. S-194]|uniref:PaaI family thioesterase n=1 Tax=Sulfolobus sp. S-194 TaxID=2512240 RepID=UPI001436F737|nr:PaaI family thioesterase [Sulfolobus sp. S-194]QIW22880.1 PaaI family thioesterase [Sulfolobus sp. S-194]
MDLQNVLENSDRVFKFLEVKILEIKPGYSKIQIPYKEEFCRRGNVLNGGIIMTAIDFAGGLATLSVNDGIDQVTQELKINFLEPMYKGPFIVEGKVVRKGRTAVVVQIEFRDSEGKLGAIALGTWYIIRDRIVKKE